MGYIYSWRQLEEYVSQLPYHQDVWMPKEAVVPPEIAGIPYIYGAYRKTLPSGGAIDTKLYADYYRVHRDKHNPSTHLIEHALDDAPLLWLFAIAIIGATISPEGERGKGASKGLELGLLALVFRGIAAKN